MLNVKSLYTNIGSQFTPHCNPPKISSQLGLFYIVSVPRTKEKKKKATAYKLQKKKKENAVNTPPAIQNNANTND